MTYSTSREIAANLVTVDASRVFEVIALNKKGIKPDKLEVLDDQEPVKKDTTKTEPAKNFALMDEPVKKDTAKTEPAKNFALMDEPVKKDTTKTEPAKNFALMDEPVKKDTTKTEPAKKFALMDEPVKKDSTKTENPSPAPKSVSIA